MIEIEQKQEMDNIRKCEVSFLALRMKHNREGNQSLYQTLHEHGNPLKDKKNWKSYRIAAKKLLKLTNKEILNYLISMRTH
jgi:hypothetical protein